MPANAGPDPTPLPRPAGPPTVAEEYVAATLPWTGPAPPAVPADAAAHPGRPPEGVTGLLAPPTAEEEFRGVLRRRLVVLNSLYLISLTYLFIIPGVLGYELGHHHDYDRLGMAAGYTATGLVVAALALLLGRRQLAVPALRAVELAAYGAMTVFLAHWQYRDFLAAADHPLAAGEYHDVLYRSVAYTNSLNWFFFILLYGLTVPNTWRRCAAVVAVDVVAPLAVHVAVVPWDAEGGRLLVKCLVGTAVTTSLAAGIAVFGSFKIGTLQQEVRAARQQLRELGQYRLTRRLGGGGMGEVYLAEHRLLKRPCAVKFLRSDLAAGPGLRARFRREVEVMARLTHPNTVEVYDYGQTEDGTFYYVMEYLPGLDLHEVVQRAGPLEPGRAVHVLRQVCAALREAHTLGLVHRDVKPRNIVLTQRGGHHDVVKLLDFGLVRLCNPGAGDGLLTQTGVILGTPGYMSPEQAAGETTLDARSDVYSVGAVGYFLLAGRAPFVGKSLAKVIAAQVAEAPPPLAELCPDVPADLAAVVGRCLAHEPAERYADAGELERALAGCACAGAWTAERAAAWWSALA
jgi:eukaryotic-like serine/threonine-protein kinase